MNIGAQSNQTTLILLRIYLQIEEKQWLSMVASLIKIFFDFIIWCLYSKCVKKQINECVMRESYIIDRDILSFHSHTTPEIE